MKTLTIKTATEDDFFKRGRTLARLADNAEALPEEYVVSFEDPADVLKLLSTARLALLKAIKEQPGSINALAKRLHRDRSAVQRDTDVLDRHSRRRVQGSSGPRAHEGGKGQRSETPARSRICLIDASRTMRCSSRRRIVRPGRPEVHDPAIARHRGPVQSDRPWRGTIQNQRQSDGHRRRVLT